MEQGDFNHHFRSIPVICFGIRIILILAFYADYLNELIGDINIENFWKLEVAGSCLILTSILIVLL